MSTATKVTGADARAALQAIRTTFRAYVDGDAGPTLMPDFDGRDWTIMWEDGPYEWPFLLGGGVDDEMAALGADIGVTFKPLPPTEFPTGMMVEPINHYSVGLYPA